MFIEQKKVARQFPYQSHKGKMCTRTCATWFGVFRCDNCNATFERQIGTTVDRRRCNNKVSHYCDNCPSHALGAQKGRVTQRQHNLLKVGTKTITSHGYVSVYVGETYSSRSVRSGSIFEHIYIMEQHLGRELAKGEVVHHINGNKQDNSLGNLDYMSVQEHNNCHGKIERVLFALYEQGLIQYCRTTKLYEYNKPLTCS